MNILVKSVPHKLNLKKNREEIQIWNYKPITDLFLVNYFPSVLIPSLNLFLLLLFMQNIAKILALWVNDDLFCKVLYKIQNSTAHRAI